MMNKRMILEFAHLIFSVRLRYMKLKETESKMEENQQSLT